MQAMKHLSFSEIQSIINRKYIDVANSYIPDRRDREDELFDAVRWTKKHENQKNAKVINQERNRDSSSSVAIKTFL